MGRHIIARVGEIPPGGRRIVEIAGRSIGVFRIGESYHALRNVCPHQGGPLCLGKVKGTNLPSPPHVYRYGMEGRILACPWHCWEFDITTGRSYFNPHKMRVKAFPVTVEPDGEEGEAAVENEEADEEPTVETFPVTVERGLIVLHA
ncbi:MAG: Rieske (2Fe-2S) protein [bacterium]